MPVAMIADQPDYSSQIGTAVSAYLLIVGIIAIASVVFTVIIYWRISAKAGYSGALSLLMFIPFVGGLILLCILAFGDWPILQELQQRRMQGNQVQQQYYQQMPQPGNYPNQPRY